MRIAAACVALLVACGDSESGGGGTKPTSTMEVLKEQFGKPDPVTLILRKMEVFRDRTCTCKDKACAEQVEKDMMEWATKNMDELMGATKKLSKAQEELGERLSKEMQQCKEKLETDYGPPPVEAP